MEQQFDSGQDSVSGNASARRSSARRPGAFAYFSGLAGISLALTVALWPLNSLLTRGSSAAPLFPGDNVFLAHVILAVIAFCCGSAAVILGLVAISRDRTPENLWLKRGKTGIFLGLISMVLLLVFLIVSLMATYQTPSDNRTHGDEIQRMNSRVA